MNMNNGNEMTYDNVDFKLFHYFRINDVDLAISLFLRRITERAVNCCYSPSIFAIATIVCITSDPR